MNETTAVDTSKWCTLHVETRTLSEGSHTIHLPPPPGIRIDMHVGVVSIRHHRKPAGQEMVALPDQVCVTPPERERMLVFRPEGKKTVTLAGITLPVEIFSRFADEEEIRPSVSSLQGLLAMGRPDPVLASVVQATVMAHKAGADDLYASSAAQFIAAHLIAPRAPSDIKPTGPLSPRQLDTVTTYMRDHLSESITLDDLSSLISYSRFHFTRCFKATTGSTPYRYLTELRIETARRHLEGSGHTINHIGHRCGFSDARTFVRNFRSIVGCTPSEYRSLRTASN